MECLEHLQLEAEAQGSWQRSSSLTGTCSPGRDGSFSALRRDRFVPDRHTEVSADGSICCEDSARSPKAQRGPKRQALPTETAECSLHSEQTDEKQRARLGVGGASLLEPRDYWEPDTLIEISKGGRDYSNVS